MSNSNTQFEHVTVIKKANVFEGKCVSHTVLFADGTRKTVGVIMPGSQLTFNVGAKELMETVSGRCRYRLTGEDWVSVGEGESFSISANSKFEIDVTGEPYHYVCHFG